jgi:hypothetical protein
MIDSEEALKAFRDRIQTVVPKSDLMVQNRNFKPQGKKLWVSEISIPATEGPNTTLLDMAEYIFQYTVNVPVNDRRTINNATKKALEIGNLFESLEVIKTTNYKTSISSISRSFQGRLSESSKWYSIVIDVNVKIYEV